MIGWNGVDLFQPVLGGYWDIGEAVVLGRFYSGLAFAFLVLVFACTPDSLSNLFSKTGLVFIGEISYGIYLAHLFFMELFKPYESFFMQFNWSIYACALLGATLLSSCLIYFIIERPFIRLGARLASGLARK